MAIEIAIMEEFYSVASARDNLARLIHDAETGHPVKIARRGKPVVVILGLSEYERLQQRSGSRKAYENWRKCWESELNGEDPFGGSRDRSPGRSVTL